MRLEHHQIQMLLDKDGPPRLTPTSDTFRRSGWSHPLTQPTKPKWSLSHLAVGLSDTWLSTDIKFKHLQMAVNPFCCQAVYIFTHSTVTLLCYRFFVNTYPHSFIKQWYQMQLYIKFNLKYCSRNVFNFDCFRCLNKTL